MTQTALITGGGSGVGKALAIELANHDFQVIIVGRRINMLNETHKHAPDKILPISADISTKNGRNKIVNSIKNNPLHYLVNNAAVVEPLKLIDAITHSEFHQHLAINLEAPLFLTQSLLHNLEMEGARILNISSGLAHHALAGTGLYSISKSGLYMLFKIWNEEWFDRGVLSGSIQPGVIDTEMQMVLRSDNSFVNRSYFESLKNEKTLRSTTDVAKIIAWMLVHMPDDQFIERDWRIDEIRMT